MRSGSRDPAAPRRGWRSRSMLALAFALGACAPDAAGGADQAPDGRIVLTDVAGREVSLPGPAERVLLGEGRQLVALALLHPNPGSIVAGWLGDFEALDPATYDLFVAQSPEIADIPLVGQTSEETFSVEKALAVRPDVAILSGGHGPSESSSETVRQLEAAGIPVVFIDFRTDPLNNTIPSVRALGRALGREAEAEAFIEFYQARLDRIAQRLEGHEIERPRVFLEMHAGGERECCVSPGRGNLGDYVRFAGGHNIGADVLPGPLGTLNPEFVISQDPGVYVATGVSVPGYGVTIGSGVDPEFTRRTLAEVITRPAVAGIEAVRTGRVHALWHNFYNTPVNILALEALATWIHPELFADLDPAATLAELNERFLAVPLAGTYWADLEEADGGR